MRRAHRPHPTSAPEGRRTAPSAPEEENLAEMIHALSDPDPAVRRTVAKILGQRGEPRAASALVASLSDPDPSVRASAVRSLGMVHRPEYREAVEAVLDDPDPRVREHAAWALWAIGDPRSTPALVARSGDPAPEVRWTVAAALGRSGGPAASAALQLLLSDPNDRVRREVVLALGASDDPSVSALLRPCFHDEARRVRTATAIVMGRRRDAESVTILLDRTQGPDPWERPAALVALGRIGDARANDVLVRAAGDPAHHIRVCALHALGEMRSERAREVALGRVGDRSWAVRGAAAVCLRRTGDPLDLSVLLTLLEDIHPWPRSAAIYALGELGLVEAVPRIREELRHPIADVRLAAIWALGRLKDDGARAELVHLLAADPTEEGTEPPTLLAEGDGAIRLASDAESRMFDTAVQALGRLRRPDEDPFIEEALAVARAQLSDEELDRLARLPSAEMAVRPAIPTLRALFDQALPPEVREGETV